MVKKKKVIKKTPQKGVKKLNLPTSKVKNTSGYYLCMGDNCHGKNISKVARDCKSNAPSLTVQRVKKIRELTKAAKVIGKFANDLERVLPR